MNPVAWPLLALTLGHMFSNAVRTLPAVASDVMARDLAVSAEALAGITGAFPAAFAAAMIPVGVALDRWGVKPVSLSLLAIAAVGTVLAALAPSASTMLLAQIVLGMGCSGMMMCPMTYAARAVPQERFSVWAGLVQSVGNSGMILSASPLAWLVEAQGWRAGFLACLGIVAIGALAVSLTVRHDRPVPVPGRSAWGDAKDVMRVAVSPRLRGLMAVAFVSFGAVLGVRGLWGGPWLMEAKGMGRVAAGNLLLGVTFALVVGPAFAGWVVGRVGHLRLLLVGGHLLAAALIVALVIGGPLAFPAWVDGLILTGFGLAIAFQILCFTLLRSLVRPEEAGRALSAQNIFFFGGAAVLQGISGIAAGFGGVAAALLTFAAALVIASLLFLRWQRP
ncbi:MFS transporter [Roseococcus pinisoli]|uniref:MFS transporter n=1 Tax=Roseococcus pinisoli TaxID=2835040 RepID=A0ABS5Q958_9PROT|nr:MFS transporter [Roseococcus pinisoli]MBS7810211.1 MFS transporter [Roseococcus pinisoli]